MITRIIKVTSNDNTWYEVQIRLLWVFWVDADILRPTFKTVYSTFEDAMSSLDKLKIKKKTRVLMCKVKI